jgi:hypothetical protein
MVTTLSIEPKNGMFSYRTWDPIYRQFTTIDSGKKTEAEAYADLRRFVVRENLRRRRLRIKGVFLPALNHPTKMLFIEAA